MINEIIEGISTALYDNFGDDYEIHMEEIEQDLKEPCFFISSLNPTIAQFLGKRYVVRNQFCIQYFPATKKVRRECNDVADKMALAFEYILVDDVVLRGTQMKYEVINGVLNFFVNFDGYLYRKGSGEATMETMETKVDAKEGV